MLAAHSCTGKMNVLFLASDDMRPEINAFSGPDFPSPTHPKMNTPNLDRLASRSLLLKKAYVQQAVCSPSRTSLLTGRRPDTTHVYDLTSYWRKVGGNFTTIPQYFKQNGYYSVGMGKIFHPGSASDNDDPISWSDSYYHPETQAFWFNKSVVPSWLSVPEFVYKDHPLPDQLIRDQAIKTLRKVAASSGSEPFFVAVGFIKPHLPFVFPERFLSYADVRLPDNPFAPVHMPGVAWSGYGELRSYWDIAKLHANGAINSTLPDVVVLNLRRAYYSAITYVDSLIGEILAELKNLGLEKNTIVSFWGDHGWQLGEHGEWCKHTNFELATHAPMMVHIPGVTDAGVVTEQLTEYVDLFPTLVDAAGLPPLPVCPLDSSSIEVCTEGSSLLPLITEVNTTAWKQYAFSQYPRANNRIMGYSIRSSRYRYTEWVDFDNKNYTPEWKAVKGVELYDHVVDPEENYNHANDRAYVYVRAKLSGALHDGWRKAIPQNANRTRPVEPVPGS